MLVADPGGHRWFWFRLQRWARRAPLATATAIGVLKALIALASLCFSSLRHFSYGLNTEVSFCTRLVWSLKRDVPGSTVCFCAQISWSPWWRNQTWMRRTTRCSLGMLVRSLQTVQSAGLQRPLHCDTSLLNGVLSSMPGLWRTLWLAGQWQGGYRCEETITVPFSNKVNYASLGGRRPTSWLRQGRLREYWWVSKRLQMAGGISAAYSVNGL